jgi:osmoprotectant transport system permease protein
MLTATILLCMVSTSAVSVDNRVVVGSKNFTEGYLLAEIMAQALEGEGFDVERRFGFGGTKVCYEALLKGEIDIYPEYTGTIQQVVLDTEEPLNNDDLSAALRAEGLKILSPLGFNNTYALAMTESLANQLDIERISDLTKHDGLRAGFSHEFLNRPD